MSNPATRRHNVFQFGGLCVEWMKKLISKNGAALIHSFRSSPFLCWRWWRYAENVGCSPAPRHRCHHCCKFSVHLVRRKKTSASGRDHGNVHRELLCVFNFGWFPLEINICRRRLEQNNKLMFSECFRRCSSQTYLKVFLNSPALFLLFFISQNSHHIYDNYFPFLLERKISSIELRLF